jgi:hypothetical protein
MVNIALQEPGRNMHQERRLWHDGERFPMLLGCTSCPNLSECGGLRIERAAFDCLTFCCNRPGDCDAVCRNNPEVFATRVRDVEGFSLDNVPRGPVLPIPSLPPLVPVIFHGNKRIKAFGESPIVCLPLYNVINCKGQSRYADALDLAAHFKIAPQSGVILTGTATDPPIENWWSLGTPRRRDAIRAMRDLNILLVTTPNYSLFTDQPRWDDLYSMKRIALVYEEFLQNGLPAALHVNARTERDWDRWGDFISARSEVTHIAIEFGTGAGWDGRIGWHLAQLARLARQVNRPLRLVVRGGERGLPALAAAFPAITYLETSTFMKAIRARRRAVITPSGKVRWRAFPTPDEESLDELLAANWTAVKTFYIRNLDRQAGMERAA